jgi:Conserved hypothetical protein 2217 (DUF2460)
MSGRIPQVSSQSMCRAGTDIRTTQVYAQAMALDHLAVSRAHVTQAFVQVITRTPLDAGQPGSGTNRFTHLFANVLIPTIPNFEWIDMIVDEVFPFDISYNSIGATRFQTDVIRVDSGHDQRASRWTQPLMEYDVAYGVRTLEQLHAWLCPNLA